MKSVGLLCVLTFLCTALFAQTQPSFDWASRGGGTNYEYSYAIATDANGNSYSCGEYSGTTVFGSTTLVSRGGEDVFISKTDNAGNWLWAKSAGGIYGDYGFGISLDVEGNCYITGYFTNQAYFGTINLPGNNYATSFVAKLDSNGNWIWARVVTGTGQNTAWAIATDSVGNSYVTGYFGNTAVFGTTTLSSNGSGDIYIARIDTNGFWFLARGAGGSNNDTGYGVSVDNLGKCCVTGYFRGTAYFGSNPLYSNGDQDIFVCRLDTNGDWLAVQRAGGPDDAYTSDQGFCICNDTDGNCYVSGIFEGTANFGAHSITSLGICDVFIAKMGANGAWQWARSCGGSDYDWGDGIATDASGNVYITGSFAGTGYFGGIEIISAGYDDVYAAELDPAGNWLWAISAGGASYAYAYGISTDISGNCYLSGYFEETASFGTTTLTSAGGTDVFIAKISVSNASGIPVPPENLTLTISGNDVLLQWDPVTEDTEGNLIVPAYYKICYASFNPYGIYSFLGATELISWTHYNGALISKGFYRVVAVVTESKGE
jgi:hypothetical protein